LKKNTLFELIIELLNLYLY